MRSIFLTLVFLVANIAHAQESPLISQAIDTLSNLITDGNAVEFKKARTVLKLDKASDGVVVFFTMEGFGGGNSYEFYMALLAPAYEKIGEGGAVKKSKAAPIRYQLLAYAQVGRKGWRHVDFSQVLKTKRGIKIHAYEYANDDPMCCPKKDIWVEYEFTSGSLIEIRGASTAN